MGKCMRTSPKTQSQDLESVFLEEMMHDEAMSAVKLYDYWDVVWALTLTDTYSVTMMQIYAIKVEWKKQQKLNVPLKFRKGFVKGF